MVEEKVRDDLSLEVGAIVDCVVEQVMPYGAFVKLSSGKKGMIHISELSHNYVKKVEDILKVEQQVKAKIIKIDDKGRIDLSIKQLESRPPRPQKQGMDEDSFEKKLSSFLKTSEMKIADINSRNNNRSGKKKTKKPK
ncbi:MAG: S1 RNA-binding domain-containing protein [Synergistales bacterium]|nr:S1 RNA-binding domain-containing protein [Synergistales bacterium]